MEIKGKCVLNEEKEQYLHYCDFREKSTVMKHNDFLKSLVMHELEKMPQAFLKIEPKIRGNWQLQISGDQLKYALLLRSHLISNISNHSHHS